MSGQPFIGCKGGSKRLTLAEMIKVLLEDLERKPKGLPHSPEIDLERSLPAASESVLHFIARGGHIRQVSKKPVRHDPKGTSPAAVREALRVLRERQIRQGGA